MSNVWKRVVPDEPAPDAATPDQIMALADRYAHVYSFVNEDTMPDARAALRAAIERVIAENERLRQRTENYDVLWLNEEYQRERAERAEAERDALKGLLREAEDSVLYHLCGTAADHVRDRLARIDAAMKDQP